MIQLNKKTTVGLSIGTLMAIASGIYMFSDNVQAMVHQVASNVVAIRSLEIRAVNNEVADLKAERRNIRREQRKYPEDDNLVEDLEEVEDELEAAVKVQDCMNKDIKKVCK